MKRIISILLAASLLIGGFVFSANAAPAELYVSTDGVIDGYTGTVYTSVENALKNISSDGGTIYIDGTVLLPAAPDVSAAAGKTITFCGYGNSATGNTVEFKNATSSFVPKAAANIVFDNITVKHQDGSTTEDWICPNGGTLTFGSGCLYEHGYRADKDIDLRMYIGAYKAANGGTINFNSAKVEYAEVGTMGGYFSGSTSHFTTTGDMIYNYNAGTFHNIYAGLRNGSTGYSTLNGDVYYNFNGATLPSSYALALGNHKNGVVNGNIFFEINGGNVNRTVKYGSTGSVDDNYNKLGNLVLTVNADKIAQSGNTVNLTVANGNVPTSRGNKFLIINHVEDDEASSNITVKVSVTDLDYYITAKDGYVKPVFEKSSDGNIGKLLGFNAISDTEGYIPMLNGKALEKNTSGYYTIPTSASVQNITFASYEDSLPGDKVYLSTDGVIDGYTGTVYTTAEAAIAAIGKDGGTIFVEGSVVLPAKPNTSAITGGALSFCGYGKNATGNTVEFKNATASFIPTAGIDIIFDDITVKHQDGTTTEDWICPNGGSITFGAGCLYADGYRADRNQYLQMHIGSYNAASIGTFNFNSPNVKYSDTGSIAGYIGGTTSNFTSNGDAVYNFNSGIFTSVYGGMRNSSTGFATLNGDVYYNFNGATLASGGTFAMGNIANGVINGNIFFNINGGNISRTLKMGSSGAISEGMASFGNLVLTVDGQKIQESGNTIKLTVADGNLQQNRNKVFIILKDKSLIDSNSKVTLTVNATVIDYYLATENGTLTPVFEKSSGGKVGKFLGFTAQPKTEGHVPAINGVMLEKNAAGYYTVTESNKLQTVTFASKADLVSVITLASGLTGTDNITEEHKNGTEFTVPACPFTPESGKVFAGWASEDKLYHEGDVITVSGDLALTATYCSAQDANYFYVSETGSDSKNGLTLDTAFATIAKAVETANKSNCENATVHISGNAAYSNIPAHTKQITFRAGTFSSDINAAGNTVFDNVTLTDTTVNTGSHTVEFTENVKTNGNVSIITGGKAIAHGGSFECVYLADGATNAFINICGAQIGTLELGSKTKAANGVTVAYTSGNVENVTAGTVPATGRITVYRNGTQLAVSAENFPNAQFADIENLTENIEITLAPDGTLNVSDSTYIYAISGTDLHYSVSGKLSASAGTFNLYQAKGEGINYIPYPTAPEGMYFEKWQLVTAGHAKAIFTDKKTVNPYYVSSLGSDDNSGTSAVAPFKTLTAAVNAIGKNSDGKVIIMDTVYWSTNASTCNVPDYNGTITFEGLSANAVNTQIIDYSESSDANSTTARLDLKGNAVFKNISFRAHHYKSLYTNNYSLRLEGKIGYIQGTTGNSVLTITAGKYGAAAENTSIYLGADCTVGTLYLGHNASASITGKLSVTIDGSTVDSIILGGSGAKLCDVDIIYKSGTVGSYYTNSSNATTKVSGDYRIFKNNGITLELDNKAETKFTGNSMIFTCAKNVIIEPTDTDNIYNVLTDITACAQSTSDGKIYYSSKGGSIGLPDGSYNITVSDTDYYTNDGDVITVLKDMAFTFDEYLYRKGRTNAIFTGWYYGDTNEAPENSSVVSAGSVLKARYQEYNPESDEFGVTGVQIRVANSSVSQGLRFIINKDNTFKNKFIIKEYGAVVLPTQYLGSGELVKDGIYTHNEKEYKSADVKAKNIFATTENGEQYTACIIGIKPENYNRNYSVRAYAICETSNGYEYTLYSAPRSSGLVKVVRNNTPVNDTDKAAFEEILSAWKNTYFGDGTTPYTNSHYPTAYTVNSSGVDVRELTIESGSDSGRPVQIAMITDSHLNTNKPEQTDALVKAMKCASFADQIVLCGDNVESASSSANMNLLKQTVWDIYPDVIAVLGNHEYFYPGSGTFDDVKAKVDAMWPHDPDYYSRLVGDKVLIVTADNARQVAFGESVYYFTEDKCDKLEKDIAYARENGYVILFFHHVALSGLDKSFMANGRMYDIVTKNADVIKGCFNGHGHVDKKSELSGSYTDKNGNTISAKIPVYALKGCHETDARGNVLFINVN